MGGQGGGGGWEKSNIIKQRAHIYLALKSLYRSGHQEIKQHNTEANKHC